MFANVAYWPKADLQNTLISPEAWFLGTASDRCKNELLTAGWEVHENLVHIIAAESH